MDERKHTEGEWRTLLYDTHYHITATVPGGTVMLATVRRDPVVLPGTWEMHKANGRIMGAAKDLLEACDAHETYLAHVRTCEECAVLLEECQEAKHLWGISNTLRKAAIAKATGSTTQDQ